MIRKLLFVLIYCLVIPIVIAQENSNETDLGAYKQAYALIWDSQARARKAEALLLDDGRRSIDELNFKEVYLLCRVYNELFETEKQMEAANLLWNLEPNNLEAMEWVVNSYLNKLWIPVSSEKSKKISPTEVINFVESSLASGKGSRRALLILKASAVLALEGEITREEKISLAADLLVEASTEPMPVIGIKHNILVIPELAIESDPIFSRYFNQEERKLIKDRIRKKASDHENNRAPSSLEGGMDDDEHSDADSPPE